MSSQTAGSSRSKSNSNLPQFMSEQPTSYSDIEEDKSWLNTTYDTAVPEDEVWLLDGWAQAKKNDLEK